MKNKALFLDRDGIIIQMHYDAEHGTIDTPLTPNQVEFTPHIFSFLKTAQQLGYLLIVISNQPGIALKKISQKNFNVIDTKITETLNGHDITLDKISYCFHHPYAKIQKYKKICNCRKPNTQLIEDAIKEFNIDSKKSLYIGDSIHDIVAGTRSGMKTILLARLEETEYLRIVKEQLGDIKPTFFARNIKQATDILRTT